MKPKDIILSFAFFSQTGIGILGNSFLIFLFLFLFLRGQKLRSIDIIVTQLAIANCLGLLSKGIPQTMTTLGFKDFLDDTGCKIVLYLHRVARNLSVSMTCLLSACQAITISPNSVELKTIIPKYLTHFSLFCWTSHLLLNVCVPWGMKGARLIENMTEMQYYRYCSNDIYSGFYAPLFTTIFSFPDAVCLGFMVSSSGYMVILLYRHHKQIQQIHITCLSPKVSPETRATKAILLLVSTFLISYSLNCILTVHMFLIKFPSGLMDIIAFLNLSFPAACPYVLISSDSQIHRHFFARCGRNSRYGSSMQCGCKKVPSQSEGILTSKET